MRENFYDYQHNRLDMLKVWGLINVALGWSASLSRDRLVRHVGFQAIAWGGIDALLAFFGQQNANQKAEETRRGKMPGKQIARDIRGFRRLLLINAGLDVGYILGGLWLMVSARERRERQGMGLGILIQGLFLLLFDALLAEEVRRKWGER
jgi:hypothetical protein